MANRRKVTADTANNETSDNGADIRERAENGDTAAAKELDNMNNERDADDTGDGSQETGEGDNETSDADPRAFDNPWFAEFPVGLSAIEGTAAHAANVAAFTAIVTRMGPKTYTARAGTVEGKEAPAAKTAVNNLLRAKRQVPAHFNPEGLEGEPAAPIISNSEAAIVDPWNREGFAKTTLDAAALELAEVDDTIIHAEQTAKQGHVRIAKIFFNTRNLFNTFTETGNYSKEQWGRWIKQQTESGPLVGHVRFNVNTASEYYFMGEAPASLIDLVPLELNSPKSFMKWTNDRKNFIAAQAAKKLFNAKNAEPAPEGEERSAIEATNGELMKSAASYIGYVRETVTTARGISKQKADAHNNSGDPQATKVSEDAYLFPNTHSDIANIAVFDWLQGEVPAEGAADYDAGFSKSRFGKALRKAWDAEVAAAPALAGGTSEPEPADKEPAAKSVSFADMPIDDAARHLLGILAGRAEIDDQYAIIDRMTAILDERQTAAEAAEKATADKAETAATK